MISKIVRNIWTIGSLVIGFLVLKKWLKLPNNESFANAIAYNHLLISLYLYGKEALKNLKPILELWLNRKGVNSELVQKKES